MYSEINDSLIDPDVFAPSKINRDLYGKFAVVPYRAFYDKRLHKHPVLFQILGFYMILKSMLKPVFYQELMVLRYSLEVKHKRLQLQH